MFHRSLRPIVFVLVWFALLMSSSIVLFKTMAGPVFVTSLQAAQVAVEDADLVDPLPPGCINGTPAGTDAPICCISGLVYFEGREVSGAEVTIADVHGIIATVQTQVYEDGLERRPYYSVDLTHLSRPVTPSQEITLTARYAGIETPPIRYRVQNGGQQVDMTIYDANVLAVKGQTQGAAEPGKFNLPYDVATDSQGNLYVIDMKNYRVQVFRPDGELLDRPKWNKGFGNLPDQFGHPQGIDIDQSTDTVYICVTCPLWPAL